MNRPICWHDLNFERIPVESRSTKGVPYVRWMPIGMPRIPDYVLKSVFYLYETVDDAKTGRNPGGTGFIVRLGWTDHYYAVTNWHVAVDHQNPVCPIIRLNMRGGGTDVLEFGPDEWEFIPGHTDIAIVPLAFDPDQHLVASISTHLFADENDHGNGEIGVGEDAFMLGLFVDHDGATTNIPSARFGNVSMLPSPVALIEQPTGYRGECYVVDMHSRTGFSGSPVFVYRTFGSDLTTDRYRVRMHRTPSSEVDLESHHNLFKLLGIHYAQFPEEWEFHHPETIKTEQKKHLVTDGAYVKGMSGMTCVIPAWRIWEVLDLPRFKSEREGQNAKPKREGVPIPERADRRATHENPTHREDFNSLLGAAVRTPEPKD